MTNLEWLRTLPAEELANWLYDEWLNHMQYTWSSSKGGLVCWLAENAKCSATGKPYSECSSCEYFRCAADEPQNTIKADSSMDYLRFMDQRRMDEEFAKRFKEKGADDD